MHADEDDAARAGSSSPLRAHTLGSIEPATLDAQKVFAWRDVVADRDDSSQVEWLASQNATLVRGDAVVTEPGVVHVAEQELRYDRLVIATGSSPSIPPIDGLDSVDYWTNRRGDGDDGGAARLAVLGGGPVGCELAQFFQRVGSQVTVVQNDDRILSRVDADAAALVAEALREDGVELRLERAGAVGHSTVSLALERRQRGRVRPAARRHRHGDRTSTGSSRSG